MDAREAIMTGGGRHLCGSGARYADRHRELGPGPKADNLGHGPHAAALSLCRVTVSRRPLPGPDASQQNPADEAV